ncbi:putative alpha beta hydrolase fold-3 domain containing protein [Diaporthe ampelina]|uniref:Putative alpha beta hydrolase fold-3 domain containing protein n=1 Tax=Diaporthe ampelina TaxID=1214573 RepID=A0A0G2FH79_9PEZI|nr:putative alpha beta hydrolase fold-3 domain containing protein [Diaporthe ampelina]
MEASCAGTPVHLLLLSVAYTVKPLRPQPGWSVKENVRAAVARMLFSFWSAIRSQHPDYAAPEKAMERHARVDPPPAAFFTGALAAADPVKPAAVDAVWFPGPPPSDPAQLAKQEVVLHFPGGAFVLAFSHESSGKSIADKFSRHLEADRVVWAQYRLSGTPEACFPAAVQDAVVFYHYIISLGVDPANVIVSGDSAGGNVAIALARYLQDGQTRLPLPRGVAVFSPWVHLTATAGKDYDQQTHSQADILHSSVLQWGADVYRPQGKPSPDLEAYISPLHRPFELSVPIYVQAGTAEGMHDQIRSFSEEMASIRANRVLFRASPLAPHNLPFCHEQFGKTKEFEESLEEAYDFLRPGNDR